MNKDKIYERAMQFMSNVSDKREGVSNVYVFTAIDKDGNVVDEKYSMNYMTNKGFSNIYANGISFTAGDSVKLVVGTGVGNPQTKPQTCPWTTADTELEIPAFNGLAATFTTSSDEIMHADGKTKSYAYPMYYSKGENDGEGFITLISRFMIAYYDYNISNYPSDTDISEYGIMYNGNTLWTHSRIYDMTGAPTTIRKTSNVRLYITVYMCLSFYESIIMNGWSKNRFTVISRNDIMYDRMGWGARVKVYKRGNRVIDITDGGTSRTQNTSENNAYTNSTIAPRMIIYDNNADSYHTDTKIFDGGYIDGFILSETGFICIEPQFLTVPEDVELINYMSEDPTVYTGFADKFGKNPSSEYSKEQYPQMTRFFDAEAYVYDWKNAGWTCKLDIYNPDNKWYDETSMGASCNVPIYYYNNGETLTGYLYQNLRPDDKIISITSGASEIYATNKYWMGSNTDTSDPYNPDKGWVWIRDYNNIPIACQSARYWITNNGSDSLTFKRESDCFQLYEKTATSNGYVQYPEYSQQYYIQPIADNYEYGWYKRGKNVYVPSVSGRPIYTVGSDSDETMTYGKWMVVFPSSDNKIITVDMSVPGTVSPQNVTTPFTGTVNSLSQTHRTETGTGLICMESTNTEECVVIDMRNNGFVQSVHSWKHACCIWGTNKVAYINAGTTDLNVYIFNFDTNQIEGNPIPFPEQITDIPHIFAHTNFLWMTNGSSFGYVCDLRTPTIRNLEGFDYSGLYGSGLNTVKYTCVDDVFIVYKYDESGSDSIKLAHYIKLSDPTNPIDMNDFSTRTSDSYIGGRIIFDLRYANRYTNAQSLSSGALVLTIMRGWSNNSSSNPNGCECRVIDFGQYLRTGEVKYQEHATNKSFGNLCLFGENIIYRYTKKIPLINYLPIKLTGKTDTINAMKHIKNITNKSWLIGYTNTPSWGMNASNPSGKPPGIPVAKTDSTGTITGWS